MTDDLSLRIAEFFEPKPEWRFQREPDGIYTKSVLGFWWKGNGYTQEVTPYTDPAITMRLLKWICEHDMRVAPDERIISSYYEVRSPEAIAQAVCAEIDRRNP